MSTSTIAKTTVGALLREAAAAFAKACEKLDAARTAYNEAAPLTPCAAAGSRNWSWGCTPWPWEG